MLEIKGGVGGGSGPQSQHKYCHTQMIANINLFILGSSQITPLEVFNVARHETFL